MGNRTPRAVFLVLMITLAANLRPRAVIAEPKTWTVDDDGLADFRTIKDAIDAASSGDTVLVKSGRYYERLVVNKPISITGENKETTIVDARGFGTVIQIGTSGVTVSSLTITNAGRNWGPPPGQGFPDSAILVNGVSNARIDNNIMFEAAVCIWVAYSSSANITENAVSAGVYGGIIGYASSNLTILSNNVHNCGLMGLHLDGNSSNCMILGNTVTNNLEGLELESGSSANRIEWNAFIGNGVSVVLDKCGSHNSFQGNTMSSSLYNFIVVGYNLESFMQDIDSSNTVNNKRIYYLTNLRGQGISPLNYPDAGWLAIVNCTNVAIKDFNFFGNGDGVLVAYSSGCDFSYVAVGGNRGDLLWGGFTFYGSNNNSMVGCQAIGNSYGLAFYLSDGNVFYRNRFADNERQVVSDFFTPFSNASSGYVSVNTWDNGIEGNYWSDYLGMDADKDGFGDTPHSIDARNMDHHPSISYFLGEDTEPPIISVISPYYGEVVRSSVVTISWEGIDYASGISHYEISVDGGDWNNVGLNTSYPFTELGDGLHTVRIAASDNAGNTIYHSVEFTVNTGVRVSWPPYMSEAIGTIAIVAVLGIALYFLKSRYSFRIRKTTRRLVR